MALDDIHNMHQLSEEGLIKEPLGYIDSASSWWTYIKNIVKNKLESQGEELFFKKLTKNI